MRIRTYALLSALLIVVLPAWAHHGWSEYETEKELTFSGTIQESGYEHPHGYIKLEAPKKIWVVVLAPPSRMERRGLAREMLKTGAKVSVTGYAHKTKPDELRAERITIGDKTVELR